VEWSGVLEIVEVEQNVLHEVLSIGDSVWGE